MGDEQRDEWYAEVPDATQHAPTFTPTITDTPTPTGTQLATNTATVINTPTGTQSVTSSPTNPPTGTQTATNTATVTNTPTGTQSVTASPTGTPIETNTATITPTSSSTSTHTPTHTYTATIQPTSTPTSTNTPGPCSEISSPSEIPTPKLINFDSLSNGTVIKSSYQSAHGIVFEDSGTTRGLIYGNEPINAKSSPNVASNDAVFPNSSSNVSFKISFDTSRTHVGFWIGNGQTASLTAVLKAFDSGGKEICNVSDAPVPDAHTEFIGVYDPAGRIDAVALDYGATLLSESIDDLYYAP